MRKNQHKKILSISAKLMSKKGYHGVSLQQISDKSKLHKSTLFHYFKNKESILVQVIEKPFDEFYKNFQKVIENHELEPEEKLKIVMDSHLSLVLESKDNVNIFLNELRNLPIKNRRIHLMKIKNYERNFEQIIAGMQKKGYFKGLDPKIVTFGILGMINWVMRWYKRRGPVKVIEISNIFYEMVTKM